MEPVSEERVVGRDVESEEFPVPVVDTEATEEIVDGPLEERTICEDDFEGDVTGEPVDAEPIEVAEPDSFSVEED